MGRIVGNLGKECAGGSHHWQTGKALYAPEDGHATGARGGDWVPEVILRALDAGPNVRVESKAAKYLPGNMGDCVGTLI